MRKQLILGPLTTLILVTLFSFSFTSCSSDDDEVDKSIVGTWEDTNNTDGTWKWTFNSNGKGSCQVINKITYSCILQSI